MTHPVPDAALETDIAILGKKGKGKTYTAKGIVERLLATKRRVCILDPLSTWWGLRSSANGRDPGFPVAVFGGEHGDMPLTEEMAKPLADMVAGNNVPCVMDLGGFTRAALTRFSTKFLDELYTKNRDPLWLVLEEADVFAPQQPMNEAAMLLAEVDRIARRGRNFGFRLISLTQRPAKLNKDVLTQLSTLIAMGVSSPQDRDAIKSWVEGNADRDQAKAVTDSLAGLQTGEGWVWAPDFNILERVRFPPITTLDTSATPKAGERRIEAKTLAQVDVTAIRDALALPATVEGSAKGAAASGAELAAAEQRGYDRGLTQGWADGYAAATHDLGGRLLQLTSDMVLELQGTPKPAPVTPLAKSAPAPATQAKVATPASGSLSPSAAKVVNTIIAAYPIGLALATAAKRAGLSQRSSAFGRYLKEAAADPRIRDRGDGRYVALAGQPGIGAPAGLADFKARLTPSFASILGVLEAAAGAELDLDTIADRAAVSRTSSGLTGGLRELVELGLAERRGAAWRLHPDFGDTP